MLPIRCVLLFIVWAVMAAQKIQVPSLVMNNGRHIPAIALGTYLGFDQGGVVASKDKSLKSAVEYAIDIGYRHMDTAAIYNTEREVGEAVREKISNGTVTRDDIFITTKLWNTHHERKKVMEAARSSLEKLGLDYVDLYLMHWPVGLNENNTMSSVDFMETWRGMEDVQKGGLAKAIGLSNFNRSQVARVLDEGEIKPATLQIEIHPNFVQLELVQFAQSEGLVLMGYSPLGFLTSRLGVKQFAPNANDPVLVEIAKKYGKTTYQVVLRWQIDRKIIPIPKTIHKDRLLQNIDVFDFKLDDDEITKIGNYEQHRYTLPSFWQEHLYYPFEKVDNPISDPFVKE